MREPRNETEIRVLLAKAVANGDRPGAAIMLRRLEDRDMRRQIILREVNQGALAGFQSEITEQAADLVIDALDAYDASREASYWNSHPWECVPLPVFRDAIRSRQRWQAKAQEAMDMRTYGDTP